MAKITLIRSEGNRTAKYGEEGEGEVVKEKKKKSLSKIGMEKSQW